jgi:hypothetical protein
VAACAVALACCVACDEFVPAELAVKEPVLQARKAQNSTKNIKLMVRMAVIAPQIAQRVVLSQGGKKRSKRDSGLSLSAI